MVSKNSMETEKRKLLQVISTTGYTKQAVYNYCKALKDNKKGPFGPVSLFYFVFPLRFVVRGFELVKFPPGFKASRFEPAFVAVIFRPLRSSNLH